MRFNGAELPPKPEDEPPDSTFPYGPCPRCGRLSNFTGIASAPLHYTGMLAIGRGGDERLFDEQVSVLACQGCRHNIVVVEEEYVGGKRHADGGFNTGGICQWRGVHWWPAPGSTPADPDVPQAVADAIAEGGPAGKFDFGKGLDAAERSASQAASSVEGEGALHSSNGDSSTSPRSRATQDAEATSLAREAGANPAFAILTSWERLTAALLDLAGARLDLQANARPPMRTGVDALQRLRTARLIDDNFYEAATQLRQLRDRVAHGQHNPTPGEAVAYVETGEELRRTAHALAGMTSSPVTKPTLSTD